MSVIVKLKGNYGWKFVRRIDVFSTNDPAFSSTWYNIIWIWVCFLKKLILSYLRYAPKFLSTSSALHPGNTDRVQITAKHCSRYIVVPFFCKRTELLSWAVDLLIGKEIRRGIVSTKFQKLMGSLYNKHHSFESNYRRIMGSKIQNDCHVVQQSVQFQLSRLTLSCSITAKRFALSMTAWGIETVWREC